MKQPFLVTTKMNRIMFASALLSLVNICGGAETVQTNQPPLVKVAEGRYQFADIQLNQKERSITFPAVVNMDEGVLEYALVHESGKVHESLLRTEVAPRDIQVALLLVSPKKNNPPTEASRPNPLPVEIFVHVEPGAETSRIEDWILNVEKKRSMTPGTWDFIGSMIRNGIFAAQSEGSIVSIIADSASIIENPREGRDNDDIWQVNKQAVPKKNTIVEVTFKFAHANSQTVEQIETNDKTPKTPSDHDSE